MNRRGRDRSREFSGPKIQKVELSESRIGLRLVLATLALLAGAATIAWAVSSALGAQTGWNRIQPTESKTPGASELTLFYDLGQGEESATAENKKLTALYAEAADSAYRLFSADEEFDGVVNLRTLSKRPNEELELEPELYDALALILEKDEKRIYLGPLLEEYGGLFAAESEEEARLFDADSNPDVAEYFERVLAFVADGSVRLELSNGNRARLCLSDAFLAYAEEMEIEKILDFGVCRSAFLMDTVAVRLREAGFTRGYLQSGEGFLCSLGRELPVSQPLYALENGAITEKGSREADGLCAVTLRSFPVRSGEYGYARLGGEYRHPYLDPETGRSSLIADSVYAESDGDSCASLLLELLALCTEGGDPDQAAAELAACGIRAEFLN